MQHETTRQLFEQGEDDAPAQGRPGESTDDSQAVPQPGEGTFFARKAPGEEIAVQSGAEYIEIDIPFAVGVNIYERALTAILRKNETDEETPGILGPSGEPVKSNRPKLDVEGYKAAIGAQYDRLLSEVLPNAERAILAWNERAQARVKEINKRIAKTVQEAKTGQMSVSKAQADVLRGVLGDSGTFNRMVEWARNNTSQAAAAATAAKKHSQILLAVPTVSLENINANAETLAAALAGIFMSKDQVRQPVEDITAALGEQGAELANALGAEAAKSQLKVSDILNSIVTSGATEVFKSMDKRIGIQWGDSGWILELLEEADEVGAGSLPKSWDRALTSGNARLMLGHGKPVLEIDTTGDARGTREDLMDAAEAYAGFVQDPENRQQPAQVPTVRGSLKTRMDAGYGRKVEADLDTYITDQLSASLGRDIAQSLRRIFKSEAVLREGGAFNSPPTRAGDSIELRLKDYLEFLQDSLPSIQAEDEKGISLAFATAEGDARSGISLLDPTAQLQGFKDLGRGGVANWDVVARTLNRLRPGTALLILAFRRDEKTEEPYGLEAYMAVRNSAGINLRQVTDSKIGAIGAGRAHSGGFGAASELAQLGEFLPTLRSSEISLPV